MKVYGPYTRKDNRQHVIIKYDDGSRRTVSYPKFLMEQALGRKLESWETVDHKDNDFTNNNMSNLQILSRSKNAAKYFEDCPDKRTKYVELTCFYCGKSFFRTVRRQRERLKNNKNPGFFCSKSCQGKTYN